MRRILYSFFAFALILSSAPAVSAAALSESQIQAILNMISVFGADSATLTSVNAALRGQTVSSSAPSSSTQPSTTSGDPRLVGNSSTSANSSTPSPSTPVITSLSQSSATERGVITIYGTNLMNPRSGETTFVTFLKNGVELGGIPADHFVSTNTRLVFGLESYNLGRFTGATHLFIRHGGLTNSPKSQAVSFSIPATPTITSVSPTSASVGQTTTFTITGTNFSGATIQYLNTVSGYSGTITPSSSSATSISFSATPSAAGIIYFNVRNADGKVSERKIVTAGTATAAAPVITVTPSSASIAYGATASFTWNVTPTTGTTCYAAGNGIGGGSGAISLSRTTPWITPNLYVNTSYGIRCTNAGGTTYKYVQVTVAPRADVTTPTTSGTSVSAPVINITSPSSSNPSIAYGERVSFSWNVTPTSGTTCQAAGTGINGTTGSGTISLSSSVPWVTPPLYTSTTYGIRCTGSTGLTTTKYVNVSVAPQASVTTPSPSISSVSPSAATVGQSTTFTIFGSNFSSAVIYYTNSSTGYSGTISPTSSSASSLSFTITPSNTGTITFYVKNADGRTSGSSSISIVSAQGANVWSAFKRLFSN